MDNTPRRPVVIPVKYPQGQEEPVTPAKPASNFNSFNWALISTESVITITFCLFWRTELVLVLVLVNDDLSGITEPTKIFLMCMTMHSLAPLEPFVNERRWIGTYHLEA